MSRPIYEPTEESAKKNSESPKWIFRLLATGASIEDIEAFFEKKERRKRMSRAKVGVDCERAIPEEIDEELTMKEVCDKYNFLKQRVEERRNRYMKAEGISIEELQRDIHLMERWLELEEESQGAILAFTGSVYGMMELNQTLSSDLFKELLDIRDLLNK